MISKFNKLFENLISEAKIVRIKGSKRPRLIRDIEADAFKKKYGEFEELSPDSLDTPELKKEYDNFCKAEADASKAREAEEKSYELAEDIAKKAKDDPAKFLKDFPELSSGLEPYKTVDERKKIVHDGFVAFFEKFLKSVKDPFAEKFPEGKYKVSKDDDTFTLDIVFKNESSEVNLNVDFSVDECTEYNTRTPNNTVKRENSVSLGLPYKVVINNYSVKDGDNNNVLIEDMLVKESIDIPDEMTDYDGPGPFESLFGALIKALKTKKEHVEKKKPSLAFGDAHKRPSRYQVANFNRRYDSVLKYIIKKYNLPKDTIAHDIARPWNIPKAAHEEWKTLTSGEYTESYDVFSFAVKEWDEFWEMFRNAYSSFNDKSDLAKATGVYEHGFTYNHETEVYLDLRDDVKGWWSDKYTKGFELKEIFDKTSKN